MDPDPMLAPSLSAASPVKMPTGAAAVGAGGGGAAEAIPAARASAPASAARLRYLPRCIVSLSSCASTPAGGRETTPHRKMASGQPDERRLLPVTPILRMLSASRPVLSPPYA